MNKKFLSAILFGALMVTSTGTFVSCKDYDDDIENVQGQVDANKNSIATLTSQAATLQTALTTAQSTADAAKTAAAEAKKAGDDALAAAKSAEAAAAQAKADAIAEAIKEVNALKAWVEGQNYVTDEELAAALAPISGKIEGIEADLSELKNIVEGLEEQLGVLNFTTISNITALQEDLAIQQAALAKLEESLNGSSTDEGLAAQIAEAKASIEELTTELDNKIGRTALTLSSFMEDYEAAMAEVKETNAVQESWIGELSKTLSALVEDAATKAELDELWTEINGEGANSIRTQLGQLAGLISEIQGNAVTLHTMLSNVTSVSLWAPQGACSWEVETLALYNVIEKNAVFGDKTPIKANENITFTEGKLVSYDDVLTIRVSPTNAVVTKEQISLINTLGENLDDYLEVTEVKAYDNLYLGNYSRSAENKSGLWNVSFKLKEGVDPVKFADEVAQKKQNGNWRYVRFAVAVKNTETKTNVISGYSVEVATPDAYSSTTLDFYANDQWIENIKNRYSRADDGTPTLDVEELWWDDRDEDIEIPAVAPILKGENKNVILKEEGEYRDNRTYYQFLPVVKGEPIAININSYKDIEGNWVVASKIAGFYVTLDKEYAVESTPSEINAWNSYEYENVGTDKQAATMIKGNSGTITIKDLNNVSGDIIGFRVYAVNLDGTLIDPDGRAFYVAIGDAAAETQVVKATIVPTSAADRIAYAELTDTQKEIIRGLYGNTAYWDIDWENNPRVDGRSAAYDIEYVKDAEGTPVSKAEEINYVKFTLWDGIEWYLDNGTYKATQTFKNERSNVLGVVEFELTKTLPTTLPAAFSAKDKQIIDGIYTCYLQPSTGGWAADPVSDMGYMDLGSVFNGLIDANGNVIDSNYKFVFANSAYDNMTDKNLVDNEVTSDYQLQVTPAADFIEAGAEHATKVEYTYIGISSYLKEDQTWVIGGNHKVTWDTEFKTVYACWHSASKLVGEKIDWEAVDASKDVITYGATDKTYDLANYRCKFNQYNDSEFGGKQTLKDLIEKKGYLTLKEAKLTSKANGKEEYFDVDDATLAFTPLKDDIQSNPKEDVPSTLTIVCEDCFGCEITFNIDYTVKKQ